MIPEEWLPALARPGVQKFIRENIHRDIFELSLSGKSVDGVAMNLVARQIQSLQKAKTKLPDWYSAGLVLPPPENLEQASSQATAEYKAGLLKGKTLADLSGGTGVDTFYCSRNFDHTTYVEPDAGLCSIASFNFRKLKATIEVVNQDAMVYLRSAPASDAYFVDPSRRDSTNGRLYKIGDCSPDAGAIAELMPQGGILLVKLSPMLDISLAIRELGRRVESVHVVAVNNEVKELLFMMGRNTQAPAITAVNLLPGGTPVAFNFHQEEERHSRPAFSECGSYLYEANASIRKAGAFNIVATRFSLEKLGTNTHLYTSAKRINAFPGRIIEVRWHGPYQPGRIKKLLGIKKANIQARNFPDDVALIRKKTGLNDGGDAYLFFYRDIHDNAVFAGGTKAVIPASE